MAKPNLAKLLKRRAAACTPEPAQNGSANQATPTDTSGPGRPSSTKVQRVGANKRQRAESSIPASRKPAPMDSSHTAEADMPTSGAGAYQTLVSMLSSGSGSTSRALRRRQYEAAGLSDDEESDSSDSPSDEPEAVIVRHPGTRNKQHSTKSKDRALQSQTDAHAQGQGQHTKSKLGAAGRAHSINDAMISPGAVPDTHTVEPPGAAAAEAGGEQLAAREADKQVHSAATEPCTAPVRAGNTGDAGVINPVPHPDLPVAASVLGATGQQAGTVSQVMEASSSRLLPPRSSSLTSAQAGVVVDSWQRQVEWVCDEEAAGRLQATQRAQWQDISWRDSGLQELYPSGIWQWSAGGSTQTSCGVPDTCLLPEPFLSLTAAAGDIGQGQGQGHQGPGMAPSTTASSGQPSTCLPVSLSHFSVKERLVARWREVQQEDRQAQADQQAQAEQGMQGSVPDPAQPGVQGQGPGHTGSDFVSPAQALFFTALHSYADITLPCRPYPSSLHTPDPIQDAYLLHCLNHINKTAELIKRNNDRLDAAQQRVEAARQAVALATKKAAEVTGSGGHGRARGKPVRGKAVASKGAAAAGSVLSMEQGG
ncbi:hypothetical protein V8C86DRAFT_2507600, partial [Haematococcus lacustris]